MPFSDNADLTTILTSAMSVLTGGGITALWLRRRLSRDSVEMAKDRAEEHIMSHLESDRDKAFADREKIIERLQEVDNQRNSALQKVERLTAEVGHMAEQIVVLKELVEKLNAALEECRKDLQEYAIENAKLKMKIQHLEETLE